MDLYKAFIFNRFVLGLLIGACIIVSALNIYLDNARGKILDSAALLIAHNNLMIISKLNEIFTEASRTPEQFKGNSEAFINNLNDKLQQNNSGFVIKLITANTIKDQFQSDAFKGLSSHKKDFFYTTQSTQDKTVFRYITLGALFGADMPQGMLEMDVPISKFQYTEEIESIKVFWVLVVLALFTTVILAILMGYFRYSAYLQKEANKMLMKSNKALEVEREQVKKLNEELEQRVIDRTKQLKKSNETLESTLGKLKHAEIFLNDIINSMPSALIILDDKLNIIQCNVQTKKYATSIKIEDLKGASLFSAFDYLSKGESQFQEAIQKDKVIKINSIPHSVAGEVKYIDAIIYPLTRNEKSNLSLRLDDVTDQVTLSMKLVQSDKMASLGVLTAGIAHEMNNPINFVSASIVPLTRNITDLMSVIEKYKNVHPNGDVKAQLAEVDTFIKSIDLTTLLEDTHTLLTAIEDGAQRTAAIVRELRNFTRVAELQMKKANVEAGLDSTILLLRIKFHERINIIKQYGHVPEIDCYPGKINQVFMNVLSNAIDSIKDKGDIYVTTLTRGDHVVIKIRDTGVGISPEHRNKIFELFFTTKPVSMGTGLGLSISYEIIKEHHGTIEFTSELDKGTEFTITLPINQG